MENRNPMLCIKTSPGKRSISNDYCPESPLKINGVIEETQDSIERKDEKSPSKVKELFSSDRKSI